MTRACFSLVLFLFLISCSSNPGEKEKNKVKRYYINLSEMGYDFSITDSLPWKQEDLLDSLIIYYKKRPILIKKFSNYPGEPIDGGYVAFYEKSLGVFYLKSTTWRSFIQLRTNDDSTNYFIDVLLGTVLSNSNMFLNPRQIDDLRGSSK
jgi:hypothetical protein